MAGFLWQVRTEKRLNEMWNLDTTTVRKCIMNYQWWSELKTHNWWLKRDYTILTNTRIHIPVHTQSTHTHTSFISNSPQGSGVVQLLCGCWMSAHMSTGTGMFAFGHRWSYYRVRALGRDLLLRKTNRPERETARERDQRTGPDQHREFLGCKWPKRINHIVPISHQGQSTV